MITIYLRTNTVNGKQYVGQTRDIKQRDIAWNCLKNRYANRYIDEDREKYGLDKWESKVLVECDDSEGDCWEQYYIKELNTKVPNGYNIADGGSGILGVKFSEETKRKLSEIKKGKYDGEKNPFYGEHHSEESRKKMSEAHKGKQQPKEIIEKKSKKVYQHTVTREFVREWESTAECGRNGFYKELISACCRGKQKTHKGFMWSYIKKEDIG